MGIERDLDEAIDTLAPDVPMFILSNRSMVNGAVTMCVPNLLAKAADSLDGDFYVLPSSVHEVICVPAEAMDWQTAAAMVHEVNHDSGTISADILLSDNVYRYSKESGELTLCQ